MSIGETLARARGRSGLTVANVSERTRIRAAIIRAIEQDDYSACGGDFYARGHIRSIAQAVGADPEPLIWEYDHSVGPPAEITAAGAFEPVTPVRVRERRRVNATVVLTVALTLAGMVAYVLYFGFGSGADVPRAAGTRQGTAGARHGAAVP